MSLFLLLVVTGGWTGFTGTVGNSGFPLPILIALVGKNSILCYHFGTLFPYPPLLVSPLCVVLFFALSRKRPPHWIMQIVLMIGAFVMSIAWLNIIANEVVSVLQAMGLLVGVSTGRYGYGA